MRGLIVKSPWAGQIVDGIKTEEYRSRKTHIRGTIGIIEAGTSSIIGSVCLIDCHFRGDHYAWILQNPQRFNPPISYKHPNGAQCWVLISS